MLNFLHFFRVVTWLIHKGRNINRICKSAFFTSNNLSTMISLYHFTVKFTWFWFADILLRFPQSFLTDILARVMWLLSQSNKNSHSSWKPFFNNSLCNWFIGYAICDNWYLMVTSCDFFVLLIWYFFNWYSMILDQSAQSKQNFSNLLSYFNPSNLRALIIYTTELLQY